MRCGFSIKLFSIVLHSLIGICCVAISSTVAHMYSRCIVRDMAYLNKIVCMLCFIGKCSAQSYEARGAIWSLYRTIWTIITETGVSLYISQRKHQTVMLDQVKGSNNETIQLKLFQPNNWIWKKKLHYKIETICNYIRRCALHERSIDCYRAPRLTLNIHYTNI